jgi:hypothetical protein
VDFAQGERIHKSTTLELTGRLVFYTGQHDVPGTSDKNSTRFRRIRGRVSFDLPSRWRGSVTWAGSTVNSLTLLDTTGFYSERHDGNLTISEKDSQRTTLSPSLILYARQDREKWGNPFADRELTRGSILEAHAVLPYQWLTFRQLNSLSTIDFPGFAQRHELWVGASAADSVGVGVGGVTASVGLRRESNWGVGIPAEKGLVSEAGVAFESLPKYNVTLHGGTQWTEELAPLAWRFGSYRLDRRPLLIAPEFVDSGAVVLVPGSAARVAGRDRYWKSSVGLRWDVGGGYADVTALTLSRPGHFRNCFVSGGSTVILNYESEEKDTTQLGLFVNASIPLKWGLKLEGSWFGQAAANDLSHSKDSRGYFRLYFERAFFSTPLIIRAHISDEFIGQRLAFSDVNYGRFYTLGPNNVVGFRVSATIRGVTMIWGTENLLNEAYSILPGYRMIHKEEYLAFIIRLWL